MGSLWIGRLRPGARYDLSWVTPRKVFGWPPELCSNRYRDRAEGRKAELLSPPVSCTAAPIPHLSLLCGNCSCSPAPRQRTRAVTHQALLSAPGLPSPPEGFLGRRLRDASLCLETGSHLEETSLNPEDLVQSSAHCTDRETEATDLLWVTQSLYYTLPSPGYH